MTVGLVLAVWRGCRTYAPARCHSPSPPLPYPPYEHPTQRIFVVFLLKIIHSPRAPRGCNSGAPRLNTRSPRLPTAAMQNTAEQLWVGEGQTLYLSNEDLMFEWTTGFATRSKNLDSLCLDKIVRAHRAALRLAARTTRLLTHYLFRMCSQVYMMMVQRSRNSLLIGAFLVSIFVPIFLGWTTIGDGCTLKQRHACENNQAGCPDDCKADEAWIDDAVILGICWGLALILVIVYICTMTTTLVFGTAPSAGMGTDGTVHIHLTGPEAQNDGDRIMKQIHRRRGAVMRGETH